jgi:DNA-binding transcriptional LysR family regulator
VVPTVFGKALALHAKAIEAQVRHAEAQLSSLKGTAKGRVSLGIGPSMASALMPAVTQLLAERQPGIELTVTEGLVDELVPALRRGELDLAVGSWPRVTDALFATEVLTSDQLLVYAHRDHPLHGRKVQLQDLAGHQWALPPASSAGARLWTNCSSGRACRRRIRR